MDNKQISDKLLEMAKFYQMTEEELMVIGKVVEMVRSADGDLISRKAVLELSKWDGREGLGSIIHAFDVERMPSVTPQPCEDAISRQAALSVFGDRDIHPLDYNTHAYITKIKSLPPVTPQQKVGRWIPVSERLPDSDGYYLGCCGDNDCSIVVDEFNKDHFCTYNVIAWMPLPEPYKQEEGAEE